MADVLSTLGIGLYQALLNLVQAFIDVIPGLVGAVILLIIGWIIGKILELVTLKIFEAVKLQDWLKQKNLTAALGKMTISELVAKIIKWWIILVFLAAGLALIQLPVLGTIAWVLVSYIPAVLAAVVIIAIGLLFGRFVKNKVLGTGHSMAKTFATIAEIAVVYIAVIMAMQTVNMREQAKILIDAFMIAFTAFVVVIAIIIGIYFALLFKKDILAFASEVKKEVLK